FASIVYMVCSCRPLLFRFFYFFFSNDTSTSVIYTLSLHDALPISGCNFIPRWKLRSVCQDISASGSVSAIFRTLDSANRNMAETDRKSTRLNSSHQIISYAVFCLKKKKKKKLRYLTK